MPDARDEAWYACTMEIEDLIASGAYRWAEPLLRGLQQTVEATHRVTPRQLETVRRVRAATRPLHDWARRYPWPID